MGKELDRLNSLKGLFRRKTVSDTPSPTSEPNSQSSQRQPSSGHEVHSEPQQPQPLPKETEPEPAPQPAALAPKPVPGTRGVFIPAYCPPEHYAQRMRLSNPALKSGQKPATMSAVVVRFFSCENLRVGREFLMSPDSKALISAAVAFLGWQSLPAEGITGGLNQGYRGLDLECDYGGYHLHYPDCAGAWPLRSDVGMDWEAVKKLHAQKFPYTVMLVGVGLGEPRKHCC